MMFEFNKMHTNTKFPFYSFLEAKSEKLVHSTLIASHSIQLYYILRMYFQRDNLYGRYGCLRILQIESFSNKMDWPFSGSGGTCYKLCINNFISTPTYNFNTQFALNFMAWNVKLVIFYCEIKNQANSSIRH